jgi:hypothetical protein
MTNEVIMVLGDGYTVPESFYNRIKYEILGVLHVLQPDVKYTAEMLCGPELWGSLKGVEPSIAGRCVADMVRKRILPLCFVGCEHLSPKCYILKSTNY